MIGDTVKVLLPGERPWVEVTAEAEGMIKGRILNRLFHEFSEFEQAQFLDEHFDSVTPLEPLHDYKMGDELWFTQSDDGWWVPVASMSH